MRQGTTMRRDRSKRYCVHCGPQFAESKTSPILILLTQRCTTSGCAFHHFRAALSVPVSLVLHAQQQAWIHLPRTTLLVVRHATYFRLARRIAPTCRMTAVAAPMTRTTVLLPPMWTVLSVRLLSSTDRDGVLY